MKGSEILVVEDSRTQAEALRELLEREEAHVHVASSAEAALEWLRSRDTLPDLVVSDVVMPGMSGYDLTRRIKSERAWRAVPVVLLTSLSDPLDIVRGLECGADNYVTKPYDAAHLIARLSHVLGQQRVSRGLRASLGINVHFLGTTFTITSDREQILDLFISSVEDVVRTNSALEQSRQELAEAQRQLEQYARQMTVRAHVSAERLRTVIEGSPLAIVAIDLSGLVTIWNAAAERIFGYQAEDVIGNAIPLVSADQRTEFDQRIQTLRAGKIVRFEAQRAHRDGHTIDVAITLAALREAGTAVDGYVAIIEDVTERKRTAEALAASQQQLAQAQKMEAIGSLAGGIAHDFNNLLTVVRSYSAMLVQDLPEQGEEADDHRLYASEILAAANRAAALTRQLLAFSRKQVALPQVLRVDDVLRGVEKFLRRLVPANIEMSYDLQAADGSVRMDVSQLEQILMNLVINASHAMPLGGAINVRTRVRTLTQRTETATGPVDAGEYVELDVQDTGAGMDAETLARLFEPFFTTKPAGTGTGLGLSIVRGIVVDQQGGVTVSSAVSRGTTFQILLPLAGASAPGEVENEKVPRTGNEVVLVVEDDAAVRDAVRIGLERFGYTVLDAPNGAQALLLTSMYGSPPDLLITDLMMPEVSGRELVEELEKEGRAPRVLMMSGYANDDIARRGLADAKYPFIQKPFTRDALARKVRDVLDAPSP